LRHNRLHSRVNIRLTRRGLKTPTRVVDHHARRDVAATGTSTACDADPVGKRHLQQCMHGVEARLALVGKGEDVIGAVGVFDALENRITAQVTRLRRALGTRRPSDEFVTRQMRETAFDVNHRCDLIQTVATSAAHARCDFRLPDSRVKLGVVEAFAGAAVRHPASAVRDAQLTGKT